MTRNVKGPAVRNQRNHSIYYTVPSLCLLAIACTNTDSARGLGRPQSLLTPLEQPLPLVIRGVQAVEGGIVRIEARCSDCKVSLDDLELCRSPQICIDLSGELSANMVVDVPSSNLFTSDIFPAVGELAIQTTSTGYIHAHFAWGADPSTLGSPYWLAALANGVQRPDDFARAGFPMDNSVYLTRDGCAQGVDTTPGDILCGVVANMELQRTAADGVGSVSVVLLNRETIDIDLLGVRLCDALRCQTRMTGYTFSASSQENLFRGGVSFAEIDPDMALTLYAPGPADVSRATVLAELQAKE